MRYIITILILSICLPLTAQNSCSPYYPSQEGKTMVIYQYDKREKLSTISEFTITDKTANTRKFSMVLKDEDGKEIVSGKFEVTCREGETILEPKALMSPGLLEQYENMEYSVTGNGLVFPATLEVGQELEDGDIEMKVDAGLMNMKINVTMTDRKVERKETVTTPAGTFDCYVITYTNTLKMGMAKTQYSTQWIAEGIGMVKEETRKSNGRLITRSILHEVR
ncbi:hypothetical protein ACJD0Z_11485 [Flavobacteriaceae bacterium M23B6Z8]